MEVSCTIVRGRMRSKDCSFGAQVLCAGSGLERLNPEECRRPRKGCTRYSQDITPDSLDKDSDEAPAARPHVEEEQGAPHLGPGQFQHQPGEQQHPQQRCPKQHCGLWTQGSQWTRVSGSPTSWPGQPGHYHLRWSMCSGVRWTRVAEDWVPPQDSLEGLG